MMEETWELKDLFQIIKKRLLLIVTLTVVAITIAGVVSYLFLTPIYQASSQMLVNKQENKSMMYETNEIQTNLQLISTYNVFIKSPVVLDAVRKELDLDLTTEALDRKITVSSVDDSQVINLVVQDESAERAAKIADKTAEVFNEEITDIMNVNNVTILTKAKVNQAPIKPNPKLNMAIAAVLGLMIGVGLSFLLDYLDKTMKNEKDVASHLELPVIGVIGEFEN